jgi:hypothetical protein
MSDFSDFTSDQYNKLYDAYFEKFPEDNSLKQSISFFSLIIAQFVADTMSNNPHLDKNYHAALLEMIRVSSKMYIDSARLQTKMEPIDWATGESLLREED